MSRHRFYRAIRRPGGALQPGATVSLYQQGTSTPVDFPVYTSRTGEEQRGPVWVTEDGVIDFYTTSVATIDIAVAADTGIVTIRDVALSGGGGPSGEVRSAVEGLYAYLGKAATGTAEFEAAWHVARIHLTNQTTQTATGAWEDHATLTYS